MSRAAGIDYGSHSLKVAEVSWSGKEVALQKVAWVPSGREEDREALASRISEKGLRIRRGVFGVSGRDSILRYTHVPPVPPWRMKLIMDYEISEIASKGGGNISADYQLLNVPRDVSQDLTIIVGMAKDERVSSHIDRMQAAGLPTGAACPTSLALFNAYRRLGEELDEAALLVNIGHENMDIAISQAGHLIFARSVQLGGKDFTEAVASALEIPFSEAEKTKHEIGAIKRDGWKDPRQKEVSDALMGVVGNLLSVIQSSVKFCRTQTGIGELKVEKVFLSGGGSRLEGLGDHLAGSLNLPVEAFDPVQRMDLGALSAEARGEAQAHSLEFLIPVGLALSEDRAEGFRLDLLPSPLKVKREFRTKTLFLYAAAAVVAATLLLNLVGAVSAILGEGSRRDALEGTLGEVEDRHGAWKDLRDANDQRVSNLEALTGETRPGYFLSVLLDAVGTSTPPQIALSEIKLEMGREGGETRASTVYRISGIADDATGVGFSLLEGYSQALDRVPAFSSAKIDTTRTKHDDKKGVWRFQIVVTPVDGSPPS